MVSEPVSIDIDCIRNIDKFKIFIDIFLNNLLDTGINKIYLKNLEYFLSGKW